MRKISIIIAALAFTLTSCEKRLVSDTILDVTPYPLDYELTEGTSNLLNFYKEIWKE